MTSAFLDRLLDEASARFGRSGRFAYYYARGKLSSDYIIREIPRRGPLPAGGNFIDLGRQERLLRRIRQALASGGVLLTRVGDAGAGVRFRIGQWVDQAVVRARGSGLSAHRCPRLDEWSALLAGLGFAVHAVPMSEGKPCANVMLVCRPADAVVQSAVGSQRRI